MAAPLNDEIQRLSYHNIRPVILHGYVLPFIFIYAVWFYTWTVVYGVNDYFEAGLIAFAIVGLLQILTALFCMWSIDVRCVMTCSKVTSLEIHIILKWNHCVVYDRRVLCNY